MIEIRPEVFKLTQSPDTLPQALQKAIELEHATIPTYLYTLYSLKQDKNEAIRQIIRSVVLEEMLHMNIAANLLNAIGGAPVIDTPHFIPKYPGHLPGAVDGSLWVTLCPFSKQHVHDVFMGIEEPEKPLDFPVDAETMIEAEAVQAAQKPLTIGMYYHNIRRQIIKGAKANPNFFSGDHKRQVVGAFPGNELFPITDVHSAMRSIDIIVEQGEGTKKKPEDIEEDFAHYYRFAEIVNGQYLVRNPDHKANTAAPPFVYGGGAIAVDESGIWPLPCNPREELYKNSQAALNANDTFNYTYTSLLKSLHRLFNGQTDQFGNALDLMESLKAQAMAMAEIEVEPGMNAGPTFRYKATNP